MTALNSFGLWGGLAALGIAVPIIIHLLYRKQRKQTDWAAMELLRRALVIRSGQVKLEDYLILALRCLALFFLATALLRPTCSSESSGILGEQRVGIVVAIDASFSMNHGEHSRFEKAVAKARKILDSAGEGDPVTIVLMSSRPEVILRGAGYKKKQVKELLDGLTTATPYRLNIEQNIEHLEELVGELKTATKECYLITDSQEVDWASMSDSARSSMDQLSKSAALVVVPVPPDADGAENLSLAGLSYTSGSLRRSGVARFSARVKNTGSRNLSNGGTIEFSVNGELSERKPVGSLDSGESRDIDFFASFEEPGNLRLNAQLSKDDLADDNTRFAVANIRPSVNILCVENPASGIVANARGSAFYAVTAFRLRDRSPESPVQINQVDAANIGLENLTDYDIVVLAGAPDIAPETVDRLKGFVRRGGGLMIFVGDGVDPEQYNERLGFGPDDGLLPAKLGENLVFEKREEGKEAGWSLGRVKSDHLLAGLVRRLPESITTGTGFRKVMRAEPAQGSETLLTVAENGTPLLLARNIGSGSVLLFTTSADLSWGGFATHPVFTMLLQQAITNLTSHPDSLQLTVGEKTNLGTPGRQVGDSVALLDPSGNTSELTLTGATGEAVCLLDPDLPGFYEVEASGEEAPGAVVAANVDPAESSVQVVDANALQSQLEPLGAVVVTGGDSDLLAAVKDARSGHELARLFLWLALAAFILQSLLAKYFTNKMGKEETTDLSATLQMSRVAAARRS